jgi:uncharacterized CHY-type Zn-finger protein
MNNKTITINSHEYVLNYYSAEIEVEELIRHYRDTEKFITYCKECNRYNACWACPPFGFNTDAYLTIYQTAHIFGTKIILDDALLN